MRENELFEANLDRLGPYVERVLERMPIWRDAGIRRIVCGAIPHTPDANPLLGPAAGLRNFWQCCGASIGIAAGAGCGKYLAQWMVHGDSEINMAGLDPRRFGGYAPGAYTKAKSHQDYEHMYALHLPGEERPASRGERVTPLYDRLAAKGCVYTEANGWERPKWFSPDGREEAPGFRHNNVFEVVAAECRAVRERVGVLDLSSFAKYEVTGAGAEAYLNAIVANRVSRRIGGIVLAHYLSDEGRILGESTITRLAEDRFYVLSGAGSEDRDLDLLMQGPRDGLDVAVANVTGDWGVLVLAGPRSREVLAKLTDAALGNGGFRWLTGREIEVAEIPVRALRVSYVGELGWELHCPMGRLAELYDALWSAGEAFGLADFGTYAVDSLRMEKAYKGWGAELTNEITLVEADMERFAAFGKENFIGRAATQRVKQAGIVTQLVYVEVEPGDCDVHGGEPVLADGRAVGVTTSGAYGHYTGKSLGFAYVEPCLAAPGTTFGIDLLGEPRAATVLAGPVYDPRERAAASMRVSSGRRRGRFLHPLWSVLLVPAIFSTEALYRSGDGGKRFGRTVQSPAVEFPQSRSFPIRQIPEYGGYRLLSGSDTGSVFPLHIQESADMVDVRHERLALIFVRECHQDVLFFFIYRRQRTHDSNRARLCSRFSWSLDGATVISRSRFVRLGRRKIIQYITNRVVSIIIDENR